MFAAFDACVGIFPPTGIAKMTMRDATQKLEKLTERVIAKIKQSERYQACAYFLSVIL